MKINLNKATQFELIETFMEKHPEPMGLNYPNNTRLVHYNFEGYPLTFPTSPDELYENVVKIIAKKVFENIPFILQSYLKQMNKGEVPLEHIFGSIKKQHYYVFPVKVKRQGIKQKGISYSRFNNIYDARLLCHSLKPEFRSLIEGYLAQRGIVKGTSYMDEMYETICKLQRLIYEELSLKVANNSFTGSMSPNAIVGDDNKDDVMSLWIETMSRRKAISSQICSILNEETTEG